MADNIQITVNPLANAPGIFHIDIKGRIDAYTVGSLEEEIENALHATNKLVITMNDVDYVNSTGVGLLVKYHDRAESMGGNIILTEIPDKVEVVFNMLGLLDFFVIYQTIEDSVRALQSKNNSGKMPEKPKARELDEIPVNSNIFPLIVKCLVCKKNLKFATRGYYRCPSCTCHYIVTDDGKARGFKNLLSRFAELRVPCTVEFFDTVVVVTKSVLDKTKLPPAQSGQVLACIQKLFQLFAKRQKPTLDIIYVFNQTSISLGFLSTEDLFQQNDAGSSAVLKDVQKMTTSFELDQTAQGANFCRFSIEC